MFVLWNSNFEYANIDVRFTIQTFVQPTTVACDREYDKEYDMKFKFIFFQNNGAQQLASEATIFIVLEDVNDEIPLFTEREQETVMEGEPIGTPVTR